jgi:hypothetical protein
MVWTERRTVKTLADPVAVLQLAIGMIARNAALVLRMVVVRHDRPSTEK